MSISNFDTNPGNNSPNDNPDQVAGGASEIRNTKADVAQSFPGFTDPATDKVTDATLGDATGPEIAFAAKNFDQAYKDSIDQAISDTADNTQDINGPGGLNHEGRINDLEALTYAGRVSSNGTWLSNPMGWAAVSYSGASAQYTFTHNLGSTLTVVDPRLTAASTPS